MIAYSLLLYYLFWFSHCAYISYHYCVRE